MDTALADGWLDANQHYLTAALADLRVALVRHIRSKGSCQVEEDEDPRPDLHEIAAAMSFPPALETVSTLFGLSPFEREVLLLCAGSELDSSFQSLCAAAQGDLSRANPTFGLALAALPNPHWSAITPASPLRHWQLIEVGSGSTLTLSPLRIDERVLHYLAGISYTDERLSGMVMAAPSPDALSTSQNALAKRIAEIWSQHSRKSDLSLIQLYGGESSDRREIAATACSCIGLGLYVMNAEDIPVGATEKFGLARLLEREAFLTGSALLLEYEDFSGAEAIRALSSLLNVFRGMLIVSSRDNLGLQDRSSIRIEVRGLTAMEQRSIWLKELGPAANSLDGYLDSVVFQFNLSRMGIHAASTVMLSAHNKDCSFMTLWDACRTQSRPVLEGLAQRIEPSATWDDLVLPDAERRMLHEIGAQVRQRAKVYDGWGFASRGGRSLGLSALFSGSSGTGKTMAAEVLAHELHLDLYRIDLSQVVSKYIGETEKNLRRVFDAAEKGGAILLFDEADALFGRRSEVKDSHDRYANIEISYLLQRMESYRGLAILTTNMKSALDSAFLRRIRFVVQFPFPDEPQRAEIWRKVFPPDVPTDGLKISRLARLSVAGGNIRNIALYAAFLAADDGEPVRMKHLLRAARVEYSKLERTPSEAEIGGWI